MPAKLAPWATDEDFATAASAVALQVEEALGATGGARRPDERTPLPPHPHYNDMMTGPTPTGWGMSPRERALMAETCLKEARSDDYRPMGVMLLRAAQDYATAASQSQTA